jgi:hypothetical protein
MATSSYANLFGTTGSGKKQGVGQTGGFGSLFGQQEATPNVPQAQPPQPTQAAPTFAQLAASGQARPAQPTMPALQPVSAGPAESRTVASATTAATQAANTQNAFMDAVRRQLASEGMPKSAYDSDLFQKLRAFQQGELEAEFGAARQGLEEEMARRGLAASSIGAGRFGDLAGQQARAMAGIDVQLLKDAAAADQAARERRDAMRMQLAQILSQVDPKNLAKLQQQFMSMGLFGSEQGG